MNFQLTKEQEQVQRRVREFAENRVAPLSVELDARNVFPADLVREMSALGIMGLPFPREYGGAGADNIAYAVAVEELSRVDGGVGVILSAHVSLGSWPIFAYGTEEQKQRYLVPLARGEKIGAFGLTEPNAGSDAAGTETTAELKGDYYLLNGKKIFTTNASHADIFVVFAVTKPGVGTHGISAFIVEKGWEGFTLGQHYDKMGIRCSGTQELLFKNVRVPTENLLGKEGEGFKIAMATLDGGRIGIASQALGIAQGAYEQALEYSQERVQFGKAIARQQSVSFKLAEMYTKIRAARFLVYSAAWQKFHHLPYGTDAAAAKMYASEICLEVVNDAVQIFGGNGYIKGFAVERMYRDAKICTIYEGTNEIQRVVVAAGLLGKAKKDTSAPEAPASGRKATLIKDGSPREKADALLKLLRESGALDADPGDTSDIATARRLVCVGMGLKEQADLAMVEELAAGLKAALACSRPVAEERKWMSMGSFVGLSGKKFKGGLYLGLGVSGQIQHMAGIRDSKVIAAINSDPAAPIFEACDYGVVGDLYEIVPLLIRALQS